MNRVLSYIMLIVISNILIFHNINSVIAQTDTMPDYPVKVPMERIIKESLLYYNKSISEKNNTDLAKTYLEISKSKIKVVELIIENQLLDNEKIDLEKELISLQTDQLRKQDEIKKNIALVKDKKNQDKIAEELLYKNAFDKLEEALTKINMAEEADSTIYSSNIFNDARTIYDEAKKNFDEGIYSQSIIYSQQSIDLADKAFEIASTNKQGIEDLNSSLKNIFGFNTKIYKSTVILSSADLFLPLSDTIRFDLYPSLDKIAETLSNHENLQIEIESYDISNKNNNKFNLSPKQSNVIKTYLNSKGLIRDIIINQQQTIPDDMVSRGVNLIILKQ